MNPENTPTYGMEENTLSDKNINTALPPEKTQPIDKELAHQRRYRLLRSVFKRLSSFLLHKGIAANNIAARLLAPVYDRIGRNLFKKNIILCKELKNLSIVSTAMRTRNIARLVKKRPLRVAFATSDSNTWQCGALYEMFQENPHFEPYLIVMPYDHIQFTKWEIKNRYETERQKFAAMGYDIRDFYKEQTDSFTLAENDMPDIVFFTSTLATNSVDILTWTLRRSYQGFLSYGYFLTDSFPPAEDKDNFTFNSKYHNRFDAIFWESLPTVEMSKKISGNSGVNSVFLGYPKIEKLIDGHIPSDPWKKTAGKLKRIIWAPHRSINEKGARIYGFSNFLEMADYMLDFARKNADRIQIAFKPHENLKIALAAFDEWGPEKTEAYYAEWDKLANGQYVEGGEYEDLFLTSDAMILDSISFICEYAFTGKPALFIISDSSVPKKLNEFGRMAFEALTYKASAETCMKEGGEIDRFLADQVFNGHDPAAPQRKNFIEAYMLHKSGKTPSENIYDFMCRITEKK